MKKPVNKVFGKKKFPTTPVPRSAADIMNAYHELRARAGEAQYQVHVYRKEVVRLNELLESLNFEMSERQKLDKDKAAEEAKTGATETKVDGDTVQQAVQ